MTGAASERLLLPVRWNVCMDILRQLNGAERRVSHMRLALLAWRSWWFSVADRLLLAARADELAQAEPHAQPLFVIGFWRSGTTMLHELLATDPQLVAPTTGDCFDPTTLLVRRAAEGESGRRIRRPMDGVEVTSSSPQEDEFALLALGLRSQYRALLLPHLLRESVQWLDPSEWPDGDAQFWSRGFRSFLRRLEWQYHRRPLLKSPSHTFRIRWLRTMFPQARFVHISRDPVQVWSSNLQTWTALFERYGLTTWRGEDIEDFIALAYAKAAGAVAWGREHLPRDSWYELSYEALCTDPVREVTALYAAWKWELTDLHRAALLVRVQASTAYRSAQRSITDFDRRAILDRLRPGMQMVGGGFDRTKPAGGAQ